jgi:hypothetical protein
LPAAGRPFPVGLILPPPPPPPRGGCFADGSDCFIFAGGVNQCCSKNCIQGICGGPQARPSPPRVTECVGAQPKLLRCTNPPPRGTTRSQIQRCCVGRNEQCVSAGGPFTRCPRGAIVLAG